MGIWTADNDVMRINRSWRAPLAMTVGLVCFAATACSSPSPPTTEAGTNGNASQACATFESIRASAQAGDGEGALGALDDALSAAEAAAAEDAQFEPLADAVESWTDAVVHYVDMVAQWNNAPIAQEAGYDLDDAASSVQSACADI